MRPVRSATLALALSLCTLAPAYAQSPLEQVEGDANKGTGPRTVPGRIIPVPTATVSPELAATIAKPYRALAWNANPPDAAAWTALVNHLAEGAAAAQPGWREKLGVTMTTGVMAGVPVFILQPKEMPAENRNRVLLNLHGGGYVYGPGEAGTGEAAAMAGYGHFKVIEVDYRMPPAAPYPAAMDDAMAVYKAVLATTDPAHVAVFGTSTGGGMTLALMLRAKAEGVPLPAAIAPGTPWSDLTDSGDSYQTNEWLDNILVSYQGYLGHAAKLYANGRDLKDPQLSPIYGDFHGFPPAILTTGTRDLFLSNTVRTHRKLRQAGVEAELQVFEGFSHAYYTIDPFIPESREAFGEIAQFLSAHLAK
ncbi:MAG: acetyl-hydrolase [Rhodopila sp.]|jgi:monoterpene epsilon-lactone hydrolase|nr:acetyl-hydrolase [Rhodopila sp.]